MENPFKLLRVLVHEPSLERFPCFVDDRRETASVQLGPRDRFGHLDPNSRRVADFDAVEILAQRLV